VLLLVPLVSWLPNKLKTLLLKRGTNGSLDYIISLPFNLSSFAFGSVCFAAFWFWSGGVLSLHSFT
jgi:hypothetical protein